MYIDRNLVFPIAVASIANRSTLVSVAAKWSDVASKCREWESAGLQSSVKSALKGFKVISADIHLGIVCATIFKTPKNALLFVTFKHLLVIKAPNHTGKGGWFDEGCKLGVLYSNSKNLAAPWRQLGG
jgi:hypothetical protein